MDNKRGEVEKMQLKRYEQVMSDRNISFEDISGYFSDLSDFIQQQIRDEKAKKNKIELNKDRIKIIDMLSTALNYESANTQELEEMLEYIESQQTAYHTHFHDSDEYNKSGESIDTNDSRSEEDQKKQKLSRDISAVITATLYKLEQLPRNNGDVVTGLRYFFDKLSGNLEEDDKKEYEGICKKALSGIKAGNYDLALELVEDNIGAIVTIKQDAKDDYKKSLQRDYGVVSKTLKNLRITRDYLTHPKISN